MEEVLYLTSDTHFQLIYTMDNLCVAKFMHDRGMPLEPNTYFQCDSGVSVADLLVFKALDKYLNAKPVEPIEDFDEHAYQELSYELQIVKKWAELKKQATQDQYFSMQLEQSQLNDEHSGIHDGFFGSCFDLLVDDFDNRFIVRIHVEYAFPLGTSILEQVEQFMNRFNELVSKWEKAVRGEKENGVGSENYD